jgi:outer membrane lipoprotein SlyB
METPVKSNRLHPLIAAAAVAVMLICLVGVAAITGLLPKSNSEGSPKQNVAELDAAAAAADKKAAEAQAAAEEAAKKRDAARLAAAKAEGSRDDTRLAQAAPVCHRCGRVESVRTIQSAAKPSGVGVVGGAIVGGLLGNQIGGGTGRSVATVAGAVGGGYAGNEIEKRTRTATSYQVRVRMEDGSLRTFPYNNVPPWHEGDHVRVVDGYLRAS